VLPNPANAVTEAVSQAAARMAAQLEASAVLALTDSGFTARMVSKHRPACPILAITGSRTVVRRLALNWGVHPVLYPDVGTDDDKIAFALQRSRELGYVHPGDIVVATAGHHQRRGGTDLIRVITLPE
jgi:pyruvate kinase